MNPSLKIALFAFVLLACRQPAYAQIDCMPGAGFVINQGKIPDYKIQHEPTAADRKLSWKYRKLITAKPDTSNYAIYYQLACSLWELGKLEKAEKMFLEIVEHDNPFYEMGHLYTVDSTTRNGSSENGVVCGIPMTYNINFTPYKHNACRYLARIYVERKAFETALRYLELADHKHVIFYAFGIGQHWNHNEINALYLMCREQSGKD